MNKQEENENKKANCTVRQRVIATSRIEELIEVCRKGGVNKLEIPGMINLELFPFSFKPEGSYLNSMDSLNDSADNMTEEDILLMSAKS